MSQDTRKIRFVRIRGRIVPIREKRDRKVGAGVAVVGAGIAAEAARTTRVYADKKTGITIDKKKFSFQPLARDIGESLHLRKNGEKAAKIYYHKTTEPGEMSVSWLSVKKKFRGQGLSKTVSKQAAIEMKDAGGKYISSHVVHPNSATLGGRESKNTYFMEKRASKIGAYTDVEQVTKKEALKQVEKWRYAFKSIKKSKFDLVREFVPGLSKENDIKVRAVFRETTLPNFKRNVRPFRTGANKAALATGLAMAVGGAYYSFSKKRSK